MLKSVSVPVLSLRSNPSLGATLEPSVPATAAIDPEAAMPLIQKVAERLANSSETAGLTKQGGEVKVLWAALRSLAGLLWVKGRRRWVCVGALFLVLGGLTIWALQTRLSCNCGDLQKQLDQHQEWIKEHHKLMAIHQRWWEEELNKGSRNRVTRAVVPSLQVMMDMLAEGHSKAEILHYFRTGVPPAPKIIEANATGKPDAPNPETKVSVELAPNEMYDSGRNASEEDTGNQGGKATTIALALGGTAVVVGTGGIILTIVYMVLNCKARSTTSDVELEATPPQGAGASPNTNDGAPPQDTETPQDEHPEIPPIAQWSTAPLNANQPPFVPCGHSH